MSLRNIYIGIFNDIQVHDQVHTSSCEWVLSTQTLFQPQRSKLCPPGKSTFCLSSDTPVIISEINVLVQLSASEF